MIEKTLCEHCVFKIVEDKKQTGCHLDRLHKLPHHDEGDFKVIDTYCSACRNVYWKNAQVNSGLSSMIDTVYEEIKSQFDVIVVCPDDYTLEELTTTLTSIENTTYKPKTVFISMTGNNANQDVARKMLDKFKSTKYDFMMSFELEQNLRINGIINKATSAFVYFITLGHTIDSNIMSDIDISVNRTFQPKLLSISDSMYVCPTFMYKYFMYEANPFKSIEDYVNKPATEVPEGDSDNSEPQLPRVGGGVDTQCDKSDVS